MLVFKRKTDIERAFVINRPGCFVGDALGLGIQLVIAADSLGAGLIGVGVELRPSQLSRQLLIIFNVADKGTVNDGIGDLPAEVAVKTKAILLVVVAIAVPFFAFQSQ